MAKLIDGNELAGYVKERHARAVRAMRAKPKLLIYAAKDEAGRSYVKAKVRYGEDIGVDVEVRQVSTERSLISELKTAEANGVVVQLPLQDGFDTDAVLEAIPPKLDVDGLGGRGPYDPAAPVAIMWLLGSVQTDLKTGKVAIVGRGRLVGAPLSRMFSQSGIKHEVFEEGDDLALLKQQDVIISATGVAGLLKPGMVAPDAVIIDAGTAMDKGSLKGDAAPALYELPKLRITPVPGGVGPVTVAALFDNLLRAAAA